MAFNARTVRPQTMGTAPSHAKQPITAGMDARTWPALLIVIATEGQISANATADTIGAAVPVYQRLALPRQRATHYQEGDVLRTIPVLPLVTAFRSLTAAALMAAAASAGQAAVPAT